VWEGGAGPEYPEETTCDGPDDHICISHVDLGILPGSQL